MSQPNVPGISKWERDPKAEYECGSGSCEPKHALHCCHIGVAKVRGGYSGFQCVVCGKRSRTWVRLQGNQGFGGSI